MKWLPKIRFSMRTLFILVTVLCVLLVPLSVKLYQARQQRLAVEWVLASGGYVWYDNNHFVPEYDGSARPSDNLWLRSVLGNDFFDSPVKVSLDISTNTDISNLSHLQSLEIVHLSDPQKADLSLLGSLKQLEDLKIFFSSEESFTAKHIKELSKLDCLLRVQIYGQLIDDLTPIQQLSNLHELSIERSQVTDLSPLIHLKQLDELLIWETPVKDISALDGKQLG